MRQLATLPGSSADVNVSSESAFHESDIAMLSECELSDDVYDYDDDVKSHHNTDIFKSSTETTFYHQNERDNNSDSSSEDEGKPVFSLRDELKEWAIASSTPLCHVSSLLSILRNYFPDLPKDGRTLLCTPNNITFQDKAGGSMHYFGVAKGILQLLSESPSLSEISQVHLQINIDGLPLFKNTSEQCWPILGLLEEDTYKSPFVRTLCG